MTPTPAREGLTAPLAETWRGRAIAYKAVNFALVGFINSCVDFGVFSLAHLHFGWPIITANVAAWLVAVTGSYTMNSLTTFAAESGRQLRLKDYTKFALSQTGGLITNTSAVFALSYFLPVLLAKALAVGVGFLVNFSLSHFVVFRRQSHRPCR
jgi:putative flippase GtrA